MSKIGRKINRRVRRILYSPKREILAHLRKSPCKFRRLGSPYGGWTFCDLPNLQGSTIISCGAGEDLSFDVEMIKNYSATIVIVDPTPRAIAHFSELKKAGVAGKRFPINQSTSEYYDLDGVSLEKISWIDKAIWINQDRLKFFKPKDDAHVSHSLTNLQDTQDFIDIETLTLAQIKKQVGDPKVALLKMDIEGAEIEVLRGLATEGVFPDQILIEFEDLNFSRGDSRKRVSQALHQLEALNYALVFFDGKSNCTFLRG
jgi:FkbM family methyltransferase